MIGFLSFYNKLLRPLFHFLRPNHLWVEHVMKKTGGAKAAETASAYLGYLVESVIRLEMGRFDVGVVALNFNLIP